MLPLVRRVHRSSALVVGAFALVHLANHVMALAGVAPHIAFMHAARQVYRAPLAEPLLIACVALQVMSGLRLAWAYRPARASALARVQMLSGVALAAFLAVHVAAVLAARALAELDTNFYFAAAGLHLRPWVFVMAPYYVLGVFALCTHLAHAAAKCLPARTAALRWSGIAVGSALGPLIVAALAGAWYPVNIPSAYAASFGSLPLKIPSR